MPQESELLKAVLEKPNDDAPRLAYAKWCEAQPEPAFKSRAAFIGAQLERARRGPRAPQSEQNDLAFTIRTLEREHRQVWAATLAHLVEEFAFDRGFVECVSLNAEDFLRRAAQLFPLAPIRHLDVTSMGRAKEFLRSPLLARLRSLSLDRCGLDDRDLQTLASNPAVADLRWLSLADNRIGFEGARALAASSFLKRLRFANLYGNILDPREQHSLDDGNVVSSMLPSEGQMLEKWHGPLAWLHATGTTIWDLAPDRFRLAQAAA